MISPQFVSEVRLSHTALETPDVYPFTIPAIASFESLPFESPVTFFAGENGSGKSTLLEAIAVASGFNAEGGSKNFRFCTRETHSDLHAHLKITKRRHPSDGYFLRAESFYNLATEIDRLGAQGSHGGHSFHRLSHGESFLSLLQNRFRGNGLYLLDEPESALSPARQLSFLSLLNTLSGQGSQFIIATHSPILLAYPGAQIYTFSGNGISLTPYRETESYTLTKQFLNSPESLLRHLFSPD